MPRLLLLLAIAAITLPSSSAQTADDLFFFGRRAPAVGARMAGMGGAAVAGLGDWSASFANPAGLGYLRSRQGVISGNGFVQGADLYGLRFHTAAEGFTLGTAAIATPLPTSRGALAVGIGYNETAVYTRSSGGNGADFDWADESGFQGELSVAGAMAVSPRVMVGLSVNAPIGQYSFDGGFIHDAIVDDPSFDAKMYGANVRAGVSVEATPALRIGLTIESPTLLNIDETGPEFGRNEYRIATPWRIAAGFLARSPRAFVSADIELVDWSQARFVTDSPNFDAENIIADRFLNPVLNTRIGGELRLGSVALRAGAAFQPDPRFDNFEPEAIRQHYSVGVGVRVTQNARIDAAFTHTRLADGARGGLFDNQGYFLWDVTHAYRNSLQIGVDMRF
ncbi:MAG: hypothetical protein IH855_05865 [Bacteroidetes bacterium]|nr:hypothetical protein [Bacteroidota bacterium]